jgi:hypothetical protein
MDEHKINNILRGSVYGGFFDAIGLLLADGIYNSRGYFNIGRAFIDPYRLLMFSASIYMGKNYIQPYLFKIKDGYYYNIDVNRLLYREQSSIIFDDRGGLKDEMIEILNTMLGTTVTAKTVSNTSSYWPYTLVRIAGSKGEDKKGEVKIDDNEYDEYYYRIDRDSPTSHRSYLKLENPPYDTLISGDLVTSPFFRYIKQYKLIVL